MAQQEKPPETVVVTDANVLINLIHADLLALLGGLPPYRFVVPDHVVNEITYAPQRKKLDAAIAARSPAVVSITSTDALAIFSELVQVMGRGEAASLALAETTGSYIACDERKGPFRRESLKRLGEGRVLGTQSIILHAIRMKRITVERADQAKTVLEANHFKMDFVSFGDLS